MPSGTLYDPVTETTVEVKPDYDAVMNAETREITVIDFNSYGLPNQKDFTSESAPTHVVHKVLAYKTLEGDKYPVRDEVNDQYYVE